MSATRLAAAVFEGTAAVVSGLVAAYCAAGGALGVWLLATGEREQGLMLLVFSAFGAWFGLVCFRAARRARRLWRGEAAAGEVFDLEWTSALSFWLLAGVVGTLASIAVPQRERVIELGRVYSARDYFDALKAAQEAHRARGGAYAGSLEELRFATAAPHGFSVESLAAGGGPAPSWRAALRREPPARSYALLRYGAYALVYDSAKSPPLGCEGALSGGCAELLRQP